ncbi:hypothetical protein MPUL_13580 [Mycolicibacterium pulveris]|uniref:DUF4386 domain-containing protein n=1 Tax=Mycolicibacterium pulveris TaxID=36813 RepID=A0A7I7UGL8_MYCPV|nr:hypothetical protein MPUL_13580 [Mycolicibacterium pulveris]
MQIFGVWCGIAYLVLIFSGWALVAGFVPPMPPTTGADEVAQLFVDDALRIRTGMVLVMFSALALIPFVAVTAQMIARIEGSAGVLTYTFLIGGVGNMVLSFYPAVWWLTAAYRADRAPELIHLVNDLSWLQFIGGVTMYFGMPLTIMVASLCDKSPDPVFPRWCGYTMGWVVLVTVPDQLLFFFQTGPFAWNGVLGLWVPAVMFGVFFISTVVVVRRALLRERQSLLAATRAASAAPPATVRR